MSGPRPAVSRPTAPELFKLDLPHPQLVPLILTFGRLANSRIVKIYVGKRKEPFEMPEDVLSYYSPYFKAAFKGSFKEGVEGVLHLPDDNPEYLELVFEYMMSSSASMDPEWEKLDPKDPDDGWAGHLYTKSLEFITLVDKYDICEAAAVISKAFAAALNTGQLYFSESPEIDQWAFVFDTLHEDNLARRVLARFLVHRLFKPENDEVSVEKFLKKNKKASSSVERELIDMTCQKGPNARVLKDGGEASCYSPRW